MRIANNEVVTAITRAIGEAEQQRSERSGWSYVTGHTVLSRGVAWTMDTRVFVT